MAHDLHRAALAIVCVFAVIFGASLFPATGFGANPVPAGGSSDGPGAGTAQPGGPDDDVDTTTSATATASESERPSGETDTETTTERTTEPSGSEGTVETTAVGSGLGESSTEDASLPWLSVFLLVGSLFVAFLGVSVGLGRHHRKRNPADWDLPSPPHLRLIAYVRRVPQTSLSFVMFAGANAPGIIDGLTSGVSDATSGITAVTSGLGTLGATLGNGLLQLPAGFVSGIGALGRGIGSITLSLPSVSGGFGSGGFFSSGENRPGSDPRSGGGATRAAAEPAEPEPPESVREAWDRLQEDLGVGSDDARTPGEMARQAVERGVPSDAIQSLTRTFRDVRYGGRPDDGDRVTVARDAYERIRAALDGDSS